MYWKLRDLFSKYKKKKKKINKQTEPGLVVEKVAVDQEQSILSLDEAA